MKRPAVWVTVLVAVAAVAVALRSPAQAAPGDATARGLVVDLRATVARDRVLDAEATIGAATAPAGGGTEAVGPLRVDLDQPGLAATGTVDEVTATRGPGASSAAAAVSDLEVRVLGVPAVVATTAAASAACPLDGDQVARASATGLRVLGEAVAFGDEPVTISAGVAVPGLTDATLSVAVSQVEAARDDRAAAAAVRAEVTVAGTLDGGRRTTIEAGTVVLAEARCERPAVPVADSLSPDSGMRSGGERVTIAGANFIPGGTTVTFGGVPATDVVVADDRESLTAIVPAGDPGVVPVVVATASGAAAPLDYTYLADGRDAVVTDLHPASGPTSGGTMVAISGSGLTGATGVTFGGEAGTGFEVDSAGTWITVTTPPGTPGPVPVEIVFPAGVAGAGTFSYTAPTIASIEPATGPTSGGTRVTIHGSGLGGATSVTFGEAAGSDLVTSPDGASLTVTTPPGSAGPVDVTIALPGPDVSVQAGFTYRWASAPAAEDGLPMTGDPTRWIVLAGAVLVGAGALTLWLIRRPT